MTFPPNRGRTAIIVQARLESTRYHGKILEKADGKTILHHVLQRCLAVPAADTVCCAIPDTPSNDGVAQEAEAAGAIVFRGAVDDVLDRYYRAARYVEGDVIMRVTSDCPLMDPDICDAVIKLRAERNVDYACNNIPVVWPHGLDCEVFTFELLEKAATSETRAWVREHVTEWMREDESVTRASLPGPGGGVETLRWTVDYPEDLEFVRALFQAAVPSAEILRYRDIMTLIAANPALIEVNGRYTTEHRNPDALPAHDFARFAAALAAQDKPSQT